MVLALCGWIVLYHQPSESRLTVSQTWAAYVRVSCSLCDTWAVTNRVCRQRRPLDTLLSYKWACSHRRVHMCAVHTHTHTHTLCCKWQPQPCVCYLCAPIRSCAVRRAASRAGPVGLITPAAVWSLSILNRFTQINEWAAHRLAST